MSKKVMVATPRVSNLCDNRRTDDDITLNIGPSY